MKKIWCCISDIENYKDLEKDYELDLEEFELIPITRMISAYDMESGVPIGINILTEAADALGLLYSNSKVDLSLYEKAGVLDDDVTADSD